MHFSTHITHSFPKSTDYDHPITENSPQLLAGLMDDLLVETFDYLSFKEISNAALVSKQWNRVSQNSRLKFNFFCQLTQYVLIDSACRFSFEQNVIIEKNSGKKLLEMVDFKVISLMIEFFDEMVKYQTYTTNTATTQVGKILENEQLIRGITEKILKIISVNQSLTSNNKQFIHKTAKTVHQIICKRAKTVREKGADFEAVDIAITIIEIRFFYKKLSKKLISISFKPNSNSAK